MGADMSLEVVFYRTESGNEPVREWLQGLSKQDKNIRIEIAAWNKWFGHLDCERQQFQSMVLFMVLPIGGKISH